MNMQWKDGKVIKVMIRSTLGGSLRLRVPNEMKMSGGGSLSKAVDENKNSFYQTEKIPEPIISAKAEIRLPQLMETWIYDIPTQKRTIYTFVIK